MPLRSLVMAVAAWGCLLAAGVTVRGQAQPDTFADISDHFRYGSVGTEERVGLPYWIWRVLPIVFADKLPNRPGRGYERLGSSTAARRTAGRSARPSRLGASGWSASTARRVMPGRSVERPATPGASCSGCRPTRWICRATRASSPPAPAIPRFTAIDADRRDREGEPRLRLVREPDLPTVRDPAHAQRHPRSGERECLVRRASAAGARPRGHLQSLQGAPEVRHAERPTGRHGRPAVALEPAIRARICGCTGTATTTRSRSATRAPPSAPARRPTRSTSPAMARIEEWILDLKPPPYPAERIDAASAPQRGAPSTQRECARLPRDRRRQRSAR